MRLCLVPFLIILSTGLSVAADLKKQPFREWQDNTGTYQVRARLVDADQTAKTVTLALQTGETVTLPLRRLKIGRASCRERV